MKKSIRVGVVEIGSRAVRLLVADHRPGEGLVVAATDSAESKLAAALHASREKQQETLARVGRAAASFVERCHVLQAERLCVFGTEALRRLPADLLGRLQQEVPGLIVLDPAREALCSLLAAAYGTQGGKAAGQVLVIDQGAASMELAAGAFVSGTLRFQSSESHPLGTQPLVELLSSCGGDLKLFRTRLEASAPTLGVARYENSTRPILLGSAATKLAWISVRRHDDDRYDPRLVHGTELTVETIDQFTTVAECNSKLIRQMIDPRHPDSTEFGTVITGLLALRLILKTLGMQNFSVSAFGTRHGMAWQLLDT